MVLSLLSSFTLMIRRLTSLPNLLTLNALNSFVKTLVLFPWMVFLSFLPSHAFASSFVVLLNMFLLFFFNVVYFVFHIKIKIKKIEKSEKYKNSVYYVYIGTCVPWMTIEIKFSKLCISCSLDEHLYAQLSK